MRRGFALLLLAAACSNPSKPPVTTGSGSASGSAVIADSGSAAKPSEIAVTDAAGLDGAKDKPANVTGKAGNAKLGAVIMLPDRTPVYCLPLDAWPSEVDGNQVTAHGTLEHSTQFMARGDAAGTSGPVWVLRDCTYDPP